MRVKQLLRGLTALGIVILFLSSVILGVSFLIFNVNETDSLSYTADFGWFMVFIIAGGFIFSLITPIASAIKFIINYVFQEEKPKKDPNILLEGGLDLDGE